MLNLLIFRLQKKKKETGIIRSPQRGDGASETEQRPGSFLDREVFSPLVAAALICAATRQDLGK